jgi:hypothetical protein
MLHGKKKKKILFVFSPVHFYFFFIPTLLATDNKEIKLVFTKLLFLFSLLIKLKKKKKLELS